MLLYPFSFCLSEKFFPSPSILNDNLSEYCPRLQIFPFQDFVGQRAVRHIQHFRREISW